MRSPGYAALAAFAVLSLATLSATELQRASSRTATTSVSILGHDPLTGEFGVAAASEAPLIGMNLEFFDVKAGGAVIHGGPHLEAGERILIALQEGLEPGRAIAVGLAGDFDRESRQALAISPAGAAAFTGEKLEKSSAQNIGDTFVAGGQAIPSPEIIDSMTAAFEGFDGSLADRLMGALKAGRDAWGADSVLHSAALLVVGPGARFATRDRRVDLRIDFTEGDAVAALETLRAQVDSVYGVR